MVSFVTQSVVGGKRSIYKKYVPAHTIPSFITQKFLFARIELVNEEYHLVQLI